MKVLLTGATGFLGSRTLEKLVEIPEVDQVVATGRTLKETHQVQHPKVTYLLGDLSDPEFTEDLAKGMDHIIHAAALSSPFGTYRAFELANLSTQHNLIRSAKKHGLNRFVFVSTPSIYFDYKDRWNIRESDPLPSKFVNHYARTKYQAELALERSGLEFISLRPRALIGRGDTVILPRLVRAQEEGKLLIVGNGENVVDITPVSNVADAIILALKADGRAVNEAYNISNGTPVRLWDTIADVLSRLGYQPPTKKLPFGLVRSVAGAQELIAKTITGKEPALTRYGVGILAKSMTLDISKARELLGYEPEMSVEEAITEFVNWYRS